MLDSEFVVVVVSQSVVLSRSVGKNFAAAEELQKNHSSGFSVVVFLCLPRRGEVIIQSGCLESVHVWTAAVLVLQHQHQLSRLSRAWHKGRQ